MSNCSCDSNYYFVPLLISLIALNIAIWNTNENHPTQQESQTPTIHLSDIIHSSKKFLHDNPYVIIAIVFFPAFWFWFMFSKSGLVMTALGGIGLYLWSANYLSLGVLKVILPS